ncbi:hypothetical protein M8C21_008943, partial [Ambrosia artemisiifolia]
RWSRGDNLRVIYFDGNIKKRGHSFLGTQVRTSHFLHSPCKGDIFLWTFYEQVYEIAKKRVMTRAK